MKTYYYHNDAGHGWLAVKRLELENLRILDKVSAYSYQNGKTVYLEEDCDIALFLKALGVSWVDFTTKFKVVQSFRQWSKIRSYDCFRV